MTARYPSLYFCLRLFSLLTSVLVLVLPGTTQHLSFFLALLLIAGLGIPHGATDHRIFHFLLHQKEEQGRMMRFYGGYLGLMLIYALLWWLSPVFSLLIFILTSMYHFGQSNWNYIRLSSLPQVLLYLLYGAFVLLVPILAHFETAQPIVESIIQWPLPQVSPLMLNGGIGGIVILNLGAIILLWMKKKLTSREVLAEVLNTFILLALFLSTPLLLGFAFYFSGWHALSSIQDQITFFQKQRPGYRLKNYVKEALPYTGLAIFGLLMMIWYSNSIQLDAAWGILFIFLSLVTLPHLLLIEMLYGTGQSVGVEWGVTVSD